MVTTANPTPDPTTDKPLRPRRWIPLSLRMFAVLLTILGAVCAWTVLRGYRQLVVIREVERLNGTIYFAPTGPVWLRSVVGDDRMRMFDKVERVALYESRASDATLRQVGGLNNLKQLLLKETQISDIGLKHLKGLTNLEELTLDDTPVTDTGLRALKGLANLKSLSLGDTQVTADGLEHLMGLTNLKDLWLCRTRVSDAGLVHLRGLTNLEELWFGTTQVTDVGVGELERALPGLRVTRW